MGKQPDLSDYVEVSERIQHFRDQYPDGSLQAEIVSLTDSLVVVKAYAYRTPDDVRPGTGLASEPIPGKTPYTKDSELMNAETSAWGRAIVAVGASDAKRVASANEVRNRQAPEPATVQERLQAEGDKVGATNALGWVAHARYGTSKLAALDDGQAQALLDDFRSDPQAIAEEAKAAREAAA